MMHWKVHYGALWTPYGEDVVRRYCIVLTNCSQHVTCDTCEHYRSEFILLGDV